MNESSQHFLREDKILSKKEGLNEKMIKEISHTEPEHSDLSERNRSINDQEATDQLEEICMPIISMNRIRIESEVVQCRKDVDE